MEISVPENSRNEQITEEGGDNEVDEVVPGIYGGRTDQNGYENVEPAGFIDFDYAGTSTVSRSDFMISLLLEV